MADSSPQSQGPPTSQEVTRCLSQVLWKIHELEATLASYDASHADILEQRLIQYEKLLASTRDLLRSGANSSAAVSEEVQRNTLAGRKLPEELIRALDGGTNPDEYLREMFKACRRDNQISKGKCDALQLLHANLLADATDAYPAETAEYRRLLGL